MAHIPSPQRDGINDIDADAFDFIIVGGGTAGCVLANRLATYLPDRQILLIEAGPSDFMDSKVLLLKDWLDLLGGDLDYDYPIEHQPMGNSHIRHSRAKVLGGCSSHNTMISFRTLEYDCKRWEARGCKGWTFGEFQRIFGKLRNQIQPVAEKHRNQLMRDWIESSSVALEIPIVEDFNKDIEASGRLQAGAGFLSIAYDAETGHRSSASVAYIHPFFRGEENLPNLTILMEAWVNKVRTTDCRIDGVDIRLKSGKNLTIHSRCETILCAGAIDTPRLLLLSGIGPQEQLSALDIPVVHNLPGVGENLMDHPESIVMWELNKPYPPNQTTMDADAAVFLRREPHHADGPDRDVVDLMFHCYQGDFGFNTTRLGYKTPVNAFCMTPNIPRPKSKGRLFLKSKDPQVKPALDFRYFTDPEGYDEATIVAGIRAARKVAQQAPFKDWIVREVAPGPALQSDQDLGEYGRRAAHTVYHPAGTTRMGDVRNDPMAVVDSALRIKGLNGVRIIDAGVFPEMTTVNPMLTVLAVAEKGAELVAKDHGWEFQHLQAKL